MTSAVKNKTSVFTWFFLILVIVIIAGNMYGLLAPSWRAAEAIEKELDISGETMGTTYSVKAWYGETEVSKEQIDQRLVEINQQMSTYMPDSEISQFNASDSTEWFPVSEQTAFVIDKSLHYHELTARASDVTVGPLVRLWDFGPGRHAIGSKLESPADELLAAAKDNSGAEKVKVRLNPPAIRKLNANVEVDLSSIAKGYAVDVVADLLIEHGFLNFMVEIGGEVRAEGTRGDERPWRIGVERPDLSQRVIEKIVSLDNQALATSGDYRNFRDFDGERVSHIIDPATGRPLPYRGWSVTVLADFCLEADVLATALLVMGEDRGYDWCEENRVAAMFLIRSEDGIREVVTSQFIHVANVEKVAETN
ncbi:MAG: FAD:protein FMN transferase [Planctomycetota bacterium]